MEQSSSPRSSLGLFDMTKASWRRSPITSFQITGEKQAKSSNACSYRLRESATSKPVQTCQSRTFCKQARSTTSQRQRNKKIGAEHAERPICFKSARITRKQGCRTCRNLPKIFSNSYASRLDRQAHQFPAGTSADHLTTTGADKTRDGDAGRRAAHT